MDDADPFLTNAQISAIAGRIDRPIVLIGLMGVGKSSVGKRLARMIEGDFRDADDEIEAATQLTIAEIFERFGEDYFRDGERRVIARLLDGGHGVIATGGGAFIHEQTRALILSKAITVWIDCDISTLVERTSRRNTRPLLNVGDPAETLRKLHNERQAFYAQAPIHVTSLDGPHGRTAATILREIDQWL